MRKNYFDVTSCINFEIKFVVYCSSLHIGFGLNFAGVNVGCRNQTRNKIRFVLQGCARNFTQFDEHEILFYKSSGKK